jgi:hypothetical protein
VPVLPVLLVDERGNERDRLDREVNSSGSPTFWPKKAEHQKKIKSVYKKSRKTTKGEEIGEKDEKWNRVIEM